MTGEAVAGIGDLIGQFGAVHGVTGRAVIERICRRQCQRDRGLWPGILIEIMEFQRRFAADPGELFGTDEVSPRCDVRGGDQRHVDLAGMQEFLQFRRRGRNHADFDIPVNGAEAFEQSREKGDQVIFRATKGDRAAQSLIRKAWDRIIMQAQDAFGVAQKSLPRAGQAHPAARTVKQALAECIFKPLYLHGDSRLSTPDLNGGSTECASMGGAHEGCQQFKIKQCLHAGLRWFMISIFLISECKHYQFYRLRATR
jgi:hypothetical protein